jgi:Ca-activated chloride channel family protein
MTFALPHLLWLLALPAALLVWEFARTRRLGEFHHPKILRAEAGLRTVSLSESGPAKGPATRRRFLLCAGLALSILALARPQWGRLDEPVFDQSRDIVIALDLSRSMLSPDVKPSRLERSKLLIEALLDRLKGERVGLIVFSGTAFLQAPMSADYEILREFLPVLGPDYLPEGGTNYRQLIDASVEAFGSASAADRFLIILSDGEATDDDWRDQIPELSKRGIRVIGLGVGTDAGAMIPDGAGAFMKDERGAVVMSKLESGTLRELAEATHGVYRNASEWVDLSKVIASTVDAGKKGRFVEHSSVRYAERFQWALAQALACLVASFWLEFPVRPKSREVRLSVPARPSPAAAAAVCAALTLLCAAHAWAADATAPDPAAVLSKIVARLSTQDRCSAQDWAEFGQESVSWGQHIKSSGQPVPEGPVRDALRAVELGSASDPKAADWPRLKSELEELLKRQDEQKQQQQQNQGNSQNPDKQQSQDQKQDQQQGQGQDQKERPPQSGRQNDRGQQQQQEQQQQQQQQEPRESRGEQKPSAFGNMAAPTPTPTPPGAREPRQAMQRVGGVPKDQPHDPAMDNPELAVPLEKLEQVKSHDSPAELFDLLRKGEPMPTPTNTGKNW